MKWNISSWQDKFQHNLLFTFWLAEQDSPFLHKNMIDTI